MRSQWLAPVLAHPAVERARQLLVAADRETLEHQIAVCQIAAPTGAEQRRARWVAEQLRRSGAEHVWQDAVGNVLARYGPADGPSVVVAAHLDTVFGPETDVAVRRHGTRLAAPGIADNARGLAALWALARAIVQAGWRPRRPLLFAATVGEEGAGDLKGAKHLFRDAAAGAAAAIALDGAGWERVVHRALGARRFRIEYRGPGGHSWAAYGTANPAHAVGRLVAGIPDLPRAGHPKSACSVVRLAGGTGLNSIPQSAAAEVDTRSEEPSQLDLIEAGLRSLAADALERENRHRAPGTSPLSLSVERIGERPSGLTPPDHPLVLAACEATRLLGREPNLAAASTDANVPIALGIPAIALGAGGEAGDVHLDTEWYDNAGGPEGLVRVLWVLAAVAGLE